jgi:TM2 domain-containing membrane protein YozV
MNRGKQKVVAGILAILLGALGIHHFYLGSTMAGVVLLAVSLVSCGFLAALSSICGIVEGIMILIMKDEEFDARYNQREPGSMEFAFMKPATV